MGNVEETYIIKKSQLELLKEHLAGKDLEIFAEIEKMEIGSWGLICDEHRNFLVFCGECLRDRLDEAEPEWKEAIRKEVLREMEVMRGEKIDTTIDLSGEIVR